MIALYDYFQVFIMEYDIELHKVDEVEKVIPDWNPPKPTLSACILSILELFHGGAFYTDKFRLSIQNSY